MKRTKWKIYKSVTTPKTHYVNVQDSNWNVKVIEQSIAGTNFKEAHHSKKVYSIEVSNGYKAVKLKFYSLGLIASKKLALEMLLSEYNLRTVS